MTDKVLEDWGIVSEGYTVRVTLQAYYDPNPHDYRESDGYGNFTSYLGAAKPGTLGFYAAAAAFDQHQADESLNILSWLNDIETDDLGYEFEVVKITNYKNGETREEVVYTAPRQTIDFTEETE